MANNNLSHVETFLKKLREPSENAWDFFDNEINIETKKVTWEEIKEKIRGDEEIDRLTLDDFAKHYVGYIEACVNKNFRNSLSNEDREDLMGETCSKLVDPERFKEGESEYRCGGIMTFKGKSKMSTWIYHIIRSQAYRINRDIHDRQNLIAVMEEQQDRQKEQEVKQPDRIPDPHRELLNKQVDETLKGVRGIVKEVLSDYDEETQLFIYNYATNGKHGKADQATDNRNLVKRSVPEIMDELNIDGSRERQMRDRWNYFQKKLKNELDNKGITINDVFIDRGKYTSIFPYSVDHM